MTPKTLRSIHDRMVAIRRDLHRHPELSWQEKLTAERICAVLDELGIPYRSGVAKTGVIGDIPGKSGAPFIALRADMDALPIQEETGLEFASANDGVMHACGHDSHMSMVLGAAELLVNEAALPAPVRLIFQPAEEVAGGANAMVAAGALDNVAMIFGGHVDRNYETGRIVVTEGTVNASTDAFTLRIIGKGGHAARPHEGVDAVVAGSYLVTAVQTIVSRETDPANPAVITIGRFDGGTASNVIASEALLEGTLRAMNATVREHLKRSLRRVAESTARLHGAEIEVMFNAGTPPVVNTGEMAALAHETAAGLVGEENVSELHAVNMGGEDFSYYLEHVPGCFVRFGAVAPGKDGFPAHSSRFDIDESVLPVGARFFHRIAKHAGAMASESS